MVPAGVPCCPDWDLEEEEEEGLFEADAVNEEDAERDQEEGEEEESLLEDHETVKRTKDYVCLLPPITALVI